MINAAGKDERERFLAGKREAGEFRYVGFALQQRINGIRLDETDYDYGYSEWFD